VCLSISLSFFLSVWLSFCLFLSLSLSLFICLFLSLTSHSTCTVLLFHLFTPIRKCKTKSCPSVLHK
jgi:hypothetical protein